MAEWKKKRQIMRHYDRLAAVYDAQYAEEQNAKIKAALSSLNLQEDSLILDVGCGTGLLFPHVTKAVKLLTGLDLSTRILREAKKRVKQLTNVAILRADADFAPFQNETFDAVFAITLLQNTPRPPVTLQEIKRISKPQALIVATGLKKDFSRRAFAKLLSQAGLKISLMETSEQLKDYVAVCRKA